MDGLNIVEKCEVLSVERQDALYTVDMHRGNKAGIMNLNSRDPIIDQEASPFLVACKTIGKQSEAGFDGDGKTIRFCWRQPISVPIDWPGQRIPELAQVLRCVTEIGVGENQS